MLIGSDNVGLNISAKVVEPEINREASNYIVNNYRELIGSIRKLDIKEEKAHDLLHDVYISIIEAEDNGNGFDMEYGNKLESNADKPINLMDVGQFVHGRVKMYAKNIKYRTDVIEANNGHVYQTDVYYNTELNKNGQEVLGKDGKPKVTKVVKSHKTAVILTSTAASFNDGGDVTENNDEFQKAFATAATAYSTDDITELYSLREQINYCIDVCDLHGVSILNIFKNLELLADMLGDISKKKKTAESVFSKLTEIADFNPDFSDALISVLRCSARNKAEFEAIIATY